jgi:tetratricopeptide (TPR) repeat protein
VDAETASQTYPLADLLAEVGWQAETLAHRLNGFATRHGYPNRVHPKTPYKWITRGETPRAPWPDLVAALISEELGRLVQPADLGWPSGETEALSAMTGLVLPWTAQGSLHALHVVADAEPMHRRLFLTLLGTAVTSPAHEWLIAHPADDVARGSGQHVSNEVVDHLDHITDGLRRLDDELGSGQVLGLVREHLRTVTDLLDNRRYTDLVGQRLHATAAELLRLAGWLSFDAGRHPQAQRYWVAALHTAHAAGDRATGANILGFMSCQAKDLGQVREAITLAETARAAYPGATPRVAAILDLRAAQAYANNQATNDSRRAIDTAFGRLTTSTPTGGEPKWCYWLDDAQANEQAGYCYLKLGDWSRARNHLRTSLRLQAPGMSREGALRRVLLATAYASQDQPDIDRAASLGGQALDMLANQVDSPRCVGHVNRLIEQLAPFRRNQAVRELTEHASALRLIAA